MEFDNSFEVPLAPAQAWAMLMDIRRIAPCMPGAELTEVLDAQHYKGKISVRLGPVALAFAGNVEFSDVNEAARTARVKAQGNDAKGRGSANATATFRIEPSGAGSRVLIHSDLMLAGAVAQYGRGVGMIQATAAQIIEQFAKNLRAQLAQQPSPPTAPMQTPSPPPASHAARTQPPAAKSPPPPPAAKPISGFALLARVIWQQLAALFTGRRG
jgi:uncharacterized protein